MPGMLGSIAGNIIISGQQAIAEYAAVRAANELTVTSLRAASATFAKVGSTFLIGGAAIGAVFAAAVGSAATFEKKIDYFGAITNASKADMQAVADKALSMSKTTIYSADQMADAFVEFGKAGISTKDILGGVADATAQLAQAADINIGDASNIIVSTMATFHIKAKDAISIANELAGAANASIIDVSDLATSLKYAGGVAEAAGVPMNSVVTALALLGNAGIKGSTGGTVLRQVMVSITAPTKAANAELVKLGINTKTGASLFVDAAGKLKPLDQIFEILRTHTEGLTQAQTLAATKVIFNSRALAGANILLKDGAAGFAAMNKQIQGVSAADVASKRLDNLSGDLTRLKNSFKTALIQAGTPFQNTMRGIVQEVTKLVQWFGNLSPATQKLIFQVLGALAAFLLIVGTLSMIISIILKVISVYKDLRAAFILIKGAVLALRDGMILLNLVIEANPFVAIVTAIILVIGALVLMYFKVKWFHDFVNTAFKDIQKWAVDFWHILVNAFNSVLTWIEGHWKLIVILILAPFILIPGLIYLYWDKISKLLMIGVNAVLDFFKAVWGKIQDWIVDPVVRAFNAVVNFFKDVWKDINSWIVDPIVNAWDAVINAFKTAYNTVTGWLSTMIAFIKYHWHLIIAIVLGPLGLVIDAIDVHKKWIMDRFTDLYNWLVGIWTITWNFVTDKVSTAWDAVVKALTTAYNAVVGVLTTMWNWVTSTASTTWNAITSTVSTAWDAVYNFLVGIWTSVETFFAARWAIFVQNSTALWNQVSGVAVAAWNAISGFFVAIWNSIAAFFTARWNIFAANSKALWARVSADAVAIWNAITAFLKAVWNAIAGFISTQAGNIETAARNIWNRIIADVKSIFNTLLTPIQNAFNTVYTYLSGVKNTVQGYFGDAVHWLETSGEDLISGLWNGISGMGGWLWDQVKHYLGSFKDKVLGFFGIRSPSKMFATIGMQLVQGLAKGMTDNTAIAVSAANGMADAVTSASQINPQVSLNSLASSSMAVDNIARNKFGTSAANQFSAQQAAAQAANPQVPNVRVFIGETELTDIVSTEIDNSLAPLTTMAKSGGLG